MRLADIEVGKEYAQGHSDYERYRNPRRVLVLEVGVEREAWHDFRWSPSLKQDGVRVQKLNPATGKPASYAKPVDVVQGRTIVMPWEEWAELKAESDEMERERRERKASERERADVLVNQLAGYEVTVKFTEHPFPHFEMDYDNLALLFEQAHGGKL